METSKLEKFAKYARRSLIEQVSGKLKQVLAAESLARRESNEAVSKLEEQIQQLGREQVIERVAYIWFNRFCALRFMDVNGFTSIGVVSPAEGQFQPEILADAKMGHIDEALASEKKRQHILDLLDGKAPSHDPQTEAYRILLVAVCNFWHQAMPFLFERIADYTELLMPDDLLSGNSILAYTREAMTPAVCKEKNPDGTEKPIVEVIGWLYQFYISEKKDQVFAGLKKNQKITPENIPAATQLFTPHWIVRYLVENSLGRLWMLNRPNSKLFAKMDYYIKPEHDDIDFLLISKPEDIKICDPACGSGHMLVYAFDLLYAIYAEEGYDAAEIVENILKHNLYGIEIDERAGELAAFALSMKTLQYDKRFFRRAVGRGELIKPQISVLTNIQFEEAELEEYIDYVGKDIFTTALKTTLLQFEEADNFGSLIRPFVSDVSGALTELSKKDLSDQLFFSLTHQQVLQALQQADYLGQKYHVVIANPPYMGSKGMNGRLGAWLKDNYADMKSDLFSAFMVRNTELALPKGQLGFMSPFVWMFISSYGKLREFLINKKTITSLIQLEYSGFDGATVPICTFTLENARNPDFRGGYVRLSNFRGSENQAPKTLEAIKNPSCDWFYRASSSDFNKIPGSPIAYWVGDGIRKLYSSYQLAGDLSQAVVGLQTGDNNRFMRFWYEVDYSQINRNFSNTDECKNSVTKWVPYNKGGAYRKWYGNREYVVNWKDDGREIRNFKDENGTLRSRPQNTSFYFKEAITWSEITSSWKSFRYNPPGSISDVKGQSAYFSDSLHLFKTLAWLNSNIVEFLTKVLNPTLSFQSGDYRNIPIPFLDNKFGELAKQAVDITKNDWDTFEVSFDFKVSPLLIQEVYISNSYLSHRATNKALFTELIEIEKYINYYLINEYALQSDIRSDVHNDQITLTCNPHYRYGSDKDEKELESLLLADTMHEFISYAVGCMFGRYALEKPGLILANQGQTFTDYLQQIPEPSFPADDDNVIPMLDAEWFNDDITERFRQFLRITFGVEHYEDNLKFIEQALGKDIRKYFLKDFYTDHVKRYKKRPIYWLFSSPKGSFNALIYMHRYRPDTVSVVLNGYLREFRTKLTARLEHLKHLEASADASKAEKTKALKDIESLKKIIDELDSYEREVLYPLATKQIEIDLDDGVKFNYGLFGAALKKIPGLDAQDED